MESRWASFQETPTTSKWNTECSPVNKCSWLETGHMNEDLFFLESEWFPATYIGVPYAGNTTENSTVTVENAEVFNSRRFYH